MWQQINIEDNGLSVNDRMKLHDYLLNRFKELPDLIAIKPLNYIALNDSILPIETFLKYNSFVYEKRRIVEVDNLYEKFSKLKEEIGEYFATRQVMEIIKKLWL